MTPDNGITRRSFIRRTAGIAAGALAAGNAAAQVLGRGTSPPEVGHDEYDLVFARVKFECDKRVQAPWNCYPGAERNLLEAFSGAVNCRVKIPPNCKDDHPVYGQDSQFNAVVNFDDPEPLRKYPFLFMSAEGAYTFSDTWKNSLRDYVESGGFLLMDDCVYHGGGNFFFTSSVRVLTETFGPDAVRPVPLDHEIFHNVYTFDNGVPFVQGQHHPATGVFAGDRLAVLLTSVDLHCGWVDRKHLWFKPRGGYDPHLESIKMGVNVLLYAMSH